MVSFGCEMALVSSVLRFDVVVFASPFAARGCLVSGESFSSSVHSSSDAYFRSLAYKSPIERLQHFAASASLEVRRSRSASVSVFAKIINRLRALHEA